MGTLLVVFGIAFVYWSIKLIKLGVEMLMYGCAVILNPSLAETKEVQENKEEA